MCSGVGGKAARTAKGEKRCPVLKQGFEKEKRVPGETRLGSGLLTEAVAAVDRTIVARFEGNLAGLATLRADRVEHGPSAAAVAGILLLARGSAILAALRFVGKTFFGEEFLLAGSEGEILSAIFADQGLVAVHWIPQKNIAQC